MMTMTNDHIDDDDNVGNVGNVGNGGNDDDGELSTNSFRVAVTTKCIQHGPISLKNGALLMLMIISSMMILLMNITYFNNVMMMVMAVMMMMMVKAYIYVFPHNQSLLMYWHVNQRLTSFLRVVFISINKICMLDLFPQMKLACCICFHKWNFKSHFKHSFCSYDRDSMTRMLNIVKPISVMFMNAHPRHKISCLHAVFIKERHTKSLHTMSVQIQKRKAILKHRCPLFSFTCAVVSVFLGISLVSFPGSLRFLSSEAPQTF